MFLQCFPLSLPCSEACKWFQQHIYFISLFVSSKRQTDMTLFGRTVGSTLEFWLSQLHSRSESLSPRTKRHGCVSRCWLFGVNFFVFGKGRPWSYAARFVAWKYSEKFIFSFLMDSELSTGLLTTGVSTAPPANRKWQGWQARSVDSGVDSQMSLHWLSKTIFVLLF